MNKYDNDLGLIVMCLKTIPEGQMKSGFKISNN